MIYCTTRFLGTRKNKMIEKINDDLTKIITEYKQGNKIEKRSIVYLEKGEPVKKEEYSFWADNTPMLLEMFIRNNKNNKNWIKVEKQWFAMTKGEA